MTQYKTIALEMIQEQPELYERLRSGKLLLTAMDAYALDLKASHARVEIGSPGRSRDATRGRSRPKPWNWRSRTSAVRSPRRRRRRNGAAVPRRGDELHPQPFAVRIRASRDQWK